MSMKSFALEKALGNKISSQHGSGGKPGRFAGAEVIDRRELRKRDHELGLIPFACKLPTALVEQLRGLGASHDGGINGAVAELLSKALGAPAGE